MKNGHSLIYGGVQKDKRAAAGVGCIIHKSLDNKILRWEIISERLLLVEMKDNSGDCMSIIVVYGPNEDDKVEEKDKFWEDLSMITEDARENIYIAGDFNSRVGQRDNIYNKSIGKYGEKARNNNGVRMLNFCQLHDLIVTNTHYQHKDIHKYTREQHTRGEKSIIDYILTPRTQRRRVIDVKVNRGAEIYSDHYLVVAKINENLEEQSTKLRSKRKVEFTTIKYYKLKDRDVADEYKQIIERKLEEKIDIIKKTNLDRSWQCYKDVIIQTAVEVCGTYTRNNKNKQTSWWSDEIKGAVKTKKSWWKEYLRSRTESNYNRYKNQRKLVKELVETAKKDSWKKFGEKIEKDSKSNQKLFYRVLKSFRKDKQTENISINDKRGVPLTEETDIMNRWREYYQEILGSKDKQEEVTEDQSKNRTEDTDEEIEDDEIMKDELEEVIKKLKNGKTPGSDKITAEMIKNVGDKGRELLLEVLNKAWTSEDIPKEWETALIMPVFKKGNQRECSNYRGITLINTIVKIYEQIINNRLKQKVEHTLEEVQSGFRPGRSIQDHIFTLRQIINKTNETGKRLYLAFLDLEKAFDRVPRAAIWESLKNRNVSNKMIRVIQRLYKSGENYIIRKNMKSEKFTVDSGLRQGGGLSPMLFNIFMDDIIKECMEKTIKLHVGYKNLQVVEISEGVFADDIMLVASSEKNLQDNLNIWNQALQKRGMKINKQKTKVMTMGDTRMNIEIEGTKIEQVERFKYLGVVIDNTGKQDAEINERIEKSIKLYYAMNSKFLHKKEISRQTKMNVYKAVCRPILTYGCESWVLTQRQKSKVQATEMKFLRRIKGVTKRDKIRNVRIREELEVSAVSDFIEQRQLGWWGHLQRMSDSRPVKRVWEARIQTQKKRGRPCQNWDKIVGNIIKMKKSTWNEAKVIARDRKKWKEFVYK